MAIDRGDLPRFTAEAVCRGKHHKEIIIDLIDAGMSRQSAQRMVDEFARFHQELRGEGVDGLQERLLQTWLSRGTPPEFASDKVRSQRAETSPLLLADEDARITTEEQAFCLQAGPKKSVMRVPTLSIVSAIICGIPALSWTAEVLWDVFKYPEGSTGWPILLLIFISPYAFLAGLSFIRGGRIWSGILFASSLLLATFGLLTQLNIIPTRGFYGVGEFMMLIIQWMGCLFAVGVAALAQQDSGKSGPVGHHSPHGDDTGQPGG